MSGLARVAARAFSLPIGIITDYRHIVNIIIKNKGTSAGFFSFCRGGFRRFAGGGVGVFQGVAPGRGLSPSHIFHKKGLTVKGTDAIIGTGRKVRGMKRAVAYCRVSTAGQVGEGKYGIDDQRAKINEYCKENDIEVVRWYIDEGVSGALLKRPALNRLLDGEETNPPIEYVVAARADRISRDIAKYYAIKVKLEERGLTILSATEDWSAQDRIMSLILENFLAMTAEIEKDHIKNRMTGGRLQKAAKGGYAGGKVPYGYKVENGKLVINESEAEVVREIFRYRGEGAAFRTIADKLNEKYKTRSGGMFVFGTVRHIVENEKTYRGWYRYGKNGEWVKGQHEPILKGEE